MVGVAALEELIGCVPGVLGGAFLLKLFFFLLSLIDLYSKGESFQTVGMSGSRQAGE